MPRKLNLLHIFHMHKNSRARLLESKENACSCRGLNRYIPARMIFIWADNWHKELHVISVESKYQSNLFRFDWFSRGAVINSLEFRAPAVSRRNETMDEGRGGKGVKSSQRTYGNLEKAALTILRLYRSLQFPDLTYRKTRIPLSYQSVQPTVLRVLNSRFDFIATTI